MYHSQNASNVFLPHYAEVFKNVTITGHYFWICLMKTLSGKSHDYRDDITFSKSSVFEMLIVHRKTKSRRFEIPPVRRAFSKNSVFVTDWHGR